MSTSYWNGQALNYDKNTKDRLAINGRILDISRKYCYQDALVMELGCGTGIFTIDFAKYVEHIDAVDFSEEMLRIAAEKSEVMNLRNISWRVEDAETALNSSEKYDLILAFYFLSYFQNPKKMIEDIYEQLEDGGIFISCTECLGEQKGIGRWFSYLKRKLGIGIYRRAFRRLDLTEIMKYTGFRILHSENLGGKFPNYFIVAKKSE